MNRIQEPKRGKHLDIMHKCQRIPTVTRPGCWEEK